MFGTRSLAFGLAVLGLVVAAACSSAPPPSPTSKPAAAAPTTAASAPTAAVKADPTKPAAAVPAAPTKAPAAAAPTTDYPTKGVTIYCGSQAGSPVDVMGREIAKHLEKELGKSVVVETKAGGSQAELLLALKDGKADGYQLATVTTSTVGALAGALKARMKPDDFDFLVQVQTDPYAIAVPASSQFKDLKGLAEYAKQNPEKVRVAGFGTGSGHHMALLDLQQKTGAKFAWVATQGGSEAIAEGLGGHVDAIHSNPGALAEHVQAGKLRVLGVTASKRVSILPDVPTYKEQGADIVASQWRGIAAKSGLPAPVKTKIIDSIVKVTKVPEFQTYMKNSSQEAGDYVGDAFQKAVLDEFKMTETTMKDLGLAK